MTIRQTRLGSNGPLVSAIGFGAMGLSEFYGATDDAASLATLSHAVDIGCTFWDTSDMYGVGHNETLLGQALAARGGRRSGVFIATKFGVLRDAATGAFAGVDSSPAHVRAACLASLARLRVDCIDLYYQHRVDPRTPIEDTVAAMAALVREGKVRFLGLSEASADTIRRAHKVHPIAAYQVEYSPWSTDIETNGILDTCNELGIAVIAYSPLGRGFLTGRYKSPDDFEEGDYRRNNPRFQGDAFVKNLEIVKALEKLAEKKGVSVSQLTLAWVLKQGGEKGTVIPIPGTKSIERLDENVGSLNVTITDEDNAAVRAIIAQIPVTGTRYDARGMASVNI
ncbi:aldo/keto reductase [Obelidium mucronatum]|nr:aldo/keto reductase [Obelidium mucronatum]